MLSILENLQELSPSCRLVGNRVGMSNGGTGDVNGGREDGGKGEVGDGDVDTCSVGSMEDDGEREIDVGSREYHGESEDGDVDAYGAGVNVKVQGILLGGDQLSTSMARRVVSERINSMDSIQSLKGVVPVVEDWHAKLCYLTVSLLND